jgi:8-oxo-dGTP pyrophosphatase MutT (NUDIX family)
VNVWVRRPKLATVIHVKSARLASHADGGFFTRLETRLRTVPSKVMEAPGLTLKEAAVLAPLFWRAGEPWAYLTMRPMTLRTHPGQISFPGGARDSGDVTPLHTALRETKEELGLDPDDVAVLGMLGAMPTITSYWVTPFVGVVPADAPLNPNSGEIAEVLEAPLWRLRRETRFIFQVDRDVYVWGDARNVVWGATYRMLDQLVEHVTAVGR